MKIEVAVPDSASTKVRGDLLEDLAVKLLLAQSYTVTQEIRMTGVELDLLCTHKVNGRQVYVECKAHRHNIDANILKNLVGTQAIKGYDEAWLISTAEFGKEAKGIVEEWQNKPNGQASSLSFYTPQRVVESLINSNVVKPAPTDKAIKILGNENLLGEWLLCLTSYGNFWLAATLASGIPKGVIAFYANNAELVVDTELLKNISNTDTTLAALDFNLTRSTVGEQEVSHQEELLSVVEVQHGDIWSDYRPSRPQDFVGRTKDLDAVFDLFKRILNRETNTRVFALTGDSGMGKSSLIAKISDKSKNKQNKNKYFVFPVDVRAASAPGYIFSALLKCLKEAQTLGFGNSEIELTVTDVSSPLNSDSIAKYINTLQDQKKLVVLVFDQFEELYSKSELYDVFNRAKSLFLGATSIKQNICLGFAWKSDSTMHGDHPAYYFWHQLADHRLTRKLSPFSDGESTAAINIFEKEIGQKLHNDLRHNLLVSSQGYPWLLKKLCIHLYDKISNGVNQSELLENKLDVRSLFDADLKELGKPERACLDLIANRAPVDWFEVVEISGPTPIDSLIHRRLIIRSGDRLNIYWDIFREYILTNKVPIIPLRYLPSTDFNSVYKIAVCLRRTRKVSVQELVDMSGFSEGTVQNIGTDINMFGIAHRESGAYLLSSDLVESDRLGMLRQIRDKFRRHAFVIAIQDKPSNAVISNTEAIKILKNIFLNSSYAEKTWSTYTVRLCRWLELCGLIVSSNHGWIYRDKGDVVTIEAPARFRGKGLLFNASASPSLTVDAITWLVNRGQITKNEQLPKGYRNAFSVLSRFALLENDGESIRPNSEIMPKKNSLAGVIWEAANKEISLIETVKLLEENSNITGQQVAHHFNEKHDLRWSSGSKTRNGRALKQWASWLLDGKEKATIPACPGRK